MENINKNKNPTIYTILSTDYVLDIFIEFSLGHALSDANLYHGLISVMKLYVTNENMRKYRSTVHPIQNILFI